MMNYPVIELKAIAAYRNIQYLQFKLPLVEYVNNAIKDAEFMDHAMDYTREVYERWFSNRGNDDYRILSRDVIYGLTMTGPDSQSHTIPTETSCPE